MNEKQIRYAIYIFRLAKQVYLRLGNDSFAKLESKGYDNGLKLTVFKDRETNKANGGCSKSFKPKSFIDPKFFYKDDKAAYEDYLSQISKFKNLKDISVEWEEFSEEEILFTKFVCLVKRLSRRKLKEVSISLTYRPCDENLNFRVIRWGKGYCDCEKCRQKVFVQNSEDWLSKTDFKKDYELVIAQIYNNPLLKKALTQEEIDLVEIKNSDSLLKS